MDPIFAFPTNTQSLNPYSYVLNNPLSMTDPTGYTATCLPTQKGRAITCTGNIIPTGSHVAQQVSMTVPATAGQPVSFSGPLAGPGGHSLMLGDTMLTASTTMGSGNGVQPSSQGPGSGLGKSAQDVTSPGAGSIPATTNAATESQAQTAPNDANAFLDSANAKYGQLEKGDFKTPEAAHEAADNEYLGASLATFREVNYAVVPLGSDDYGYTYPLVGGAHQDIIPIADLIARVYANFGGYDSIGHTHTDSNPDFSPSDQRLVLGTHKALWLGNRRGELKYLTQKYMNNLGLRRPDEVRDVNVPGQKVDDVNLNKD